MAASLVSRLRRHPPPSARQSPSGNAGARQFAFHARVVEPRDSDMNDSSYPTVIAGLTAAWRRRRETSEAAMLWVKAFHIIFVVTWFAGLFYLPRLFVYHAMSDDKVSQERFKIMERKLFYGIMTPSAVLAALFVRGCGWEWATGFSAGWLNVKLVLVVILLAYMSAGKMGRGLSARS